VAADSLARADPLPRIIEWLNGHADVLAALGGAGRIGLANEPPYPRVRVFETPAGSDGDLIRLISPEVQIEVYGDLDGSPGKAELRRIMYIVLGALRELPDAEAPFGGPVVTAVRSSRPGGWIPEPTGQPRYVAGVRVYSHAG
jgi:hypothetical protein